MSSSEPPPLPDLLASRAEQDDVVGNQVNSSLTFEEALALHPDLSEVWTRSRGACELVVRENNALAEAQQKGIAAPPNIQHRLHAINMAYCRELDHIMTKLEEEKEQLRIELLRTMYQQLCPIWQQMVLQIHMTRAGLKFPGSMHEGLVKEATALLQRAQQG